MAFRVLLALFCAACAGLEAVGGSSPLASCGLQGEGDDSAEPPGGGVAVTCRAQAGRKGLWRDVLTNRYV